MPAAGESKAFAPEAGATTTGPGSTGPLLESAPFGQIALRNTFWNGLQFAVGSVVGLACSAVVARALAPAGMGAYSYLIWVSGVAVVVASLGLPEALLKYVSEFTGSGDRGLAATVARRLLALQLLVGGVVALAALAMGLLFLHPFSVTAVALASGLVLPQVLLRATTSILGGVHRYDLLALSLGLGSVAQLAFVAAAALLHAGLLGMLLAVLAAAVVALITSLLAVYRVFLRHDAAPSTADHASVFRRVRFFSLALAYNLLIDLVVWQRSEIVLLKRYLPWSDIAFYTIAYTLTAKSAQVADTITGALLPVFSASFGSHGAQRLAAPFHKAIKYVQIVMVPICIGGVLLIGPVVRLFYGERYLPAVAVGQVLMAAVMLTSLAGVGSSLVYATDNAPFLAKWLTIAAAVKIALAVGLIPRYGTVGAALANSGAQALVVVVMLRFVAQVVGAGFPWAASAHVGLSAALAALPALAVLFVHLPLIWLLAALSAGVPIYFVALTAFGEFGPYERGLLGDWWQSTKISLHRFPRLRSLRYFLIELLKTLAVSDHQARCELEYRAQTDPLGYARESEQLRFRRALQMLDDVRGTRKFSRTLEVGCAEGDFTRLLSSRCESLIAVDFSRTALERAIERFAGDGAVQFRVLDLRSDPLPPAFDLIVAVGVLEYIYRPRDLRAIREKLVAALRPGGYLLVGNTVRSPVVENSSWVRWLPRGTRLNTFIAEHSQVRLLAEATDEFALPFRHTLVQKL